MKRIACLLLSAALLFATISGCTPTTNNPGGTPSNSGNPSPSNSGNGSVTEVVSQGVTDTEILIGCSYAFSGSWAFIGVPVYDTMKGVFDRINANGGIRGRQIRFIAYDDGYDAATGKAMVEKLVEEDKVFALNCLGGHVIPTSLDYLKDIGIPVVNFTSGLSVIYSENDPGGTVFPVQPSNVSGGPHMLARALHESIFGPNRDEKLPDDTLIGVVSFNNEAGVDVYNGIMAQAEREGVTDRIMSEVVTAETYATAIQKMKAAGVGVVLFGGTDTKTFVAAMDDARFEVPFIAAYGASTVQSYSPETYKPGRPIYAPTWGDYSTERAAIMLEDLNDALTYNKDLDAATLEAYKDNNYARAGYAAAIVMAMGLERLDASGDDLTWENFIKALESENVAFGEASWSYANGRRMGIEDMALFEYFVEEDENGNIVGAQNTLRPFESIEDIMKK